jgi:methyltransferase family protein
MSHPPLNNKSIADERSILNLDRVVFIGRSFSEYMWMFNLDGYSFKNLEILDCPSGASSFVAEVSAKYEVKKAVGCDLMYDDNNVPVLESRGKDDLEYMINRLSQVPEFYSWEMYSNIEALRRSRAASLMEFISDYRSKEQLNNHSKNYKRYVKGILPNLPFSDKSFDLVLSSNFLFYYHNMFGYDFHHDSILEMLRVSSKEVRIFPVQKPDAKIPEYFDTLMQSIKEHMKNKVSFRIEKVKYEFRDGVNKMLVINRAQ